jgi:hypothetical protein
MSYMFVSSKDEDEEGKGRFIHAKMQKGIIAIKIRLLKCEIDTRYNEGQKNIFILWVKTLINHERKLAQ